MYGDTTRKFDLDTIDSRIAAISEKYVYRCNGRAHTPAVESHSVGHRFAVRTLPEEMHVATIGRQVTPTVN